MPVGTCDPTTRDEPYNIQELSKGNGFVTVTVRYGWDGVSTRDTGNGCDGPLIDGTGPASNKWAIQVINNDNKIWYLHTVGRKGQPRDIGFNPGTTTRYNVNQASVAGFDSLSDIAELSLTTSPVRA